MDSSKMKLFPVDRYTSLTNRVPHGSVVTCFTRNPGALGSSRTGSSGFSFESVLGQDTSEPGLVLVKPRKDMNNVRCRRDITDILLKLAQNTFQSTSLTTVFQLFNGNSPQIHVSWTIVNQFLTSPLS